MYSSKAATTPTKSVRIVVDLRWTRCVDPAPTKTMSGGVRSMVAHSLETYGEEIPAVLVADTERHRFSPCVGIDGSSNEAHVWLSSASIRRGGRTSHKPAGDEETHTS